MSVDVDPLDHLLDRAAASLQDDATSGPSPELVARTLERIGDARVTRVEPPPSTNRTRIRGRWTGIALAASMLLCLGAWSLFTGASSRAFAQVVEAVQRTMGLSVEVVATIGSQPPQRVQMEFLGNKLRVEWMNGKLVGIGDLESRRTVILDIQRKLAQELTLSESKLHALVNPIEELRQAKGADAESLGTEMVDGRVMDVFRMKKAKLLDMTGIPEMRIWVDPATHLPARILVMDNDPKSELRIAFEKFDWEAAPEPAQFVLAIPEGYERKDLFIGPGEPAAPLKAAPANPQTRLISSDRVPRAIAWSADSHSLTAIMGDPETTPVQQIRPQELRQWVVADAEVRWSVDAGGGSSLAASADGMVLATTIGREIQIRSAVDGAVIKTLAAKRLLPALALNRDGRLLISGIADWQAEREGTVPAGGVEVWDVEAATILRTLQADEVTTRVAISPDGQWIAGASNDLVKLWRASDGNLARTVAAQSCMAFSPDSARLAIAAISSEGRQSRVCVEVYDLGSLKKVQTFSIPDAKCTLLDVEFSPDSRLVAGGSWEGKLYRWDLHAGDKPIHVDTVPGGIHAVMFSPDGMSLATGSEDGALQVWTAE